MLRILVVHNRYQRSGGEDAVVCREVSLLRKHGYDVAEWTEDNTRISQMAPASVAARTVWSRESHRTILRLVREHRSQVVHFHNTFPLVSPSAYYAVQEAGAAVVQTLHNYRLICPAALLFRENHPCEDCVGRFAPWPAILHKCYRDSRLATAVVSAMLTVHRTAGTWRGAVDAYIALTEFARERLIAGGLPADRIFVKPNFVDAPLRVATPQDSRTFLYVGRLSPEKGVGVLLSAWHSLGDLAPPLRIVGDGPQLPEVREQGRRLPSVEVIGPCPAAQVAELMSHAAALIVPSLWYEGFPAVVAEAFGGGLPVIASGIGSLGSIVTDGTNGIHVKAGDPTSLADAVRLLVSNPGLRAHLGHGARCSWTTLYTADVNHEMLRKIYGEALARAQEQNRKGA